MKRYMLLIGFIGCLAHLQSVAFEAGFEILDTSFKTDSGVVEVKNYLTQPLAIQILQSPEDKSLLITDKLYMVPAATGSKKEELGYLRFKLYPAKIIEKPLTFFIYVNPEENDYLDIQNGTNLNEPNSLKGKFSIKPNSKRQRSLISVEKDKKYNFVTLRPQSSEYKGLSSTTVTKISIKNNVVAKDIGKNVLLPK